LTTEKLWGAEIMDAEHYWNLLSRKGEATVGFSLATCAIYAAKFGVCGSQEIMDEKWLRIAVTLKATYGNNLTAEQAIAEMKSSWLPEQ
jgi:hypothetical protein